MYIIGHDIVEPVYFSGLDALSDNTGRRYKAIRFRLIAFTHNS